MREKREREFHTAPTPLRIFHYELFFSSQVIKVGNSPGFTALPGNRSFFFLVFFCNNHTGNRLIDSFCACILCTNVLLFLSVKIYGEFIVIKNFLKNYFVHEFMIPLTVHFRNVCMFPVQLYVETFLCLHQS